MGNLSFIQGPREFDSPRRYVDEIKHGVMAEVRVGVDPQGRPCVVLQFEDSWITLLPDDARRYARHIIFAASDAEHMI